MANSWQLRLIDHVVDNDAVVDDCSTHELHNDGKHGIPTMAYDVLLVHGFAMMVDAMLQRAKANFLNFLLHLAPNSKSFRREGLCIRERERVFERERERKKKKTCLYARENEREKNKHL